jgi:cytochrome c biogenesis protein CcmG/thiol:disulfide interchange protein DsbE
MARRLLPLALFLLLAIFLAAGLRLNPSEVPSPLVDQPAPAFDLPLLGAADQRLTRDDMLGKVWLLNVWASWCVSCREEHPLLVKLAAGGELPIYGLDYKDAEEDALAWLRRHGDLYVQSAVDRDGRTVIDYGVYGVPETYLIDAEGVIR